MWLWLAFGSAAGLLLLGRKHALLASPIDSVGRVRLTPRGQFGARRPGPPVHEHQGIDIAASVGAPVRAVGDGAVVETKAGLGKIVRKLQLDVPAMWTVGARRVVAIVYADLGQPLVEPGQRVNRGEPIALVGDAGFFHFAVKARERHGEVFIDPREAGFEYHPIGPEVT